MAIQVQLGLKCNPIDQEPLTTARSDPWTQLCTRHDFAADEVISALQKEVRRGKELERGLRHFWETGAQLEPELPGRDTTYRGRVLQMLTDTETDPKGDQ